jgi:hypothetical protein
VDTISGRHHPGRTSSCARCTARRCRKITVVGSKTIMTPSAQFALGQKQFANDLKPLAPAIATIRQGKPPVPNVTLPDSPNAVLAGSGVPNSSGSVDEFGKSTIKVPVGGTVTWAIGRLDHVPLGQDERRHPRWRDGTNSHQRTRSPAGGAGTATMKEARRASTGWSPRR